MKKWLLGAVAILCLSACSYRVYPVSTLEENYKLAMETPEELSAKEAVTIYLSEREVPGPYKLIAFVESRPAFPVAIASQQSKNFYKQAVLKAYELGGNAIIVSEIGSFKVIDVQGMPQKKHSVKPQPQQEQTRAGEGTPSGAVHQGAPESAPSPEGPKPSHKFSDRVKGGSLFKRQDQKEPDSDKAPAPAQAQASTPAPAQASTSTRSVTATPQPSAPAQPAASTPAPSAPAPTPAAATPKAAPSESPIFDDSTAQWFTSGYVYRAKEQEQTEIIQAMNQEIRDNLKICTTREEADCIAKKIELLENYNNALPIPSGSQTNKIKGYRNNLGRIIAALDPTQEQPKSSGIVDGAIQSVKGFFNKNKVK